MIVLEHSSNWRASIAVATVLLLGLVGAAATRTSFAATTNSGVVIPLYTYPTDGTWAATLQARNAHPNVPIIAVINPNNGPGGSSDPNYVKGVNSFQAAGIIVLGYVATGYASHAMSDLDAQVSSYWNWYRVNGIMFDEMSNVQGNENYYSTLNTYVKSLGMTMTMGNPGTSVPKSYIGTLDSLCIFEQNGTPTLSYLSSYSAYPKSNFAYIGLSVSPLDTAYEASSANYVRWVYITDAGGGNPYDVLPSYFMNEVATLDEGTRSSTSTSTTTSTRTTTMTRTSTATGTAAALSISTVDSNNQPLNGYYIQEIKDNTDGSSTGGTFTPQTIRGVVGHSYSVTVDDYGSRYVEGANIGNFARNVVVPHSGTTTFTMQGTTNLAFTEALLATSSTTTTTTTSGSTTTTTSHATTTSQTTTTSHKSTTSHTHTSTSSHSTTTTSQTTTTSETTTTTSSPTGTATSTATPQTTVTSKTASPTTTTTTTTSKTTQSVTTSTPTATGTVYQDTFKAVDLFGLPISGATVKVSAANGTQITKPTDSNGVASFDLPNGTYSADLTYMGVTSSVTDQSSGPHSTTVTFILSFPILVVAGLFVGTLAAVVVRQRWHRHKADLGPVTF